MPITRASAKIDIDDDNTIIGPKVRKTRVYSSYTVYWLTTSSDSFKFSLYFVT